jgi:DNA-binding GntR family transcriptional regulator
MIPFPRIPQQRVLTDWVTASIREAILCGHFEPGEKLDQDLIAQELDVSRTPIREALSKLESEGFVEIRPHRGAFVVMPSREDIRYIYEVLGILEAEIVRQVTPIIPESLLDEMEVRLAQDQRKLEKGDNITYSEIDTPRFPISMFQFIDNTLLREIMDGLNHRIEIVRRLIRRQEPFMVDSLREHQIILATLRQRDAEKAAELTKSHLEQSASRVLSSIQEPESLARNGNSMSHSS